MRKNMFEKVVLLCLSLSVFFLFSACQMFTTSWGKAFQRNQQDFLKKASASELLAFSQGANASSPETVKAVLNLLSEKSPAELKSLSLSDKEAALNLTLDAALPMKKISQIASEAQNITNGNGGGEDFMRKLLKDTDSFDTRASVELLGDRTAMEKAAPDVLANAAVAVIVQVAAKNDYDKIKAKIDSSDVDFESSTQTAQDIVNKMLGAADTDGAIGTAEDRAALKAAVNVAKLLSGATNATASDGKKVTRTLNTDNVKLLGAVPLKNILSAFSNK